MLQMKCFTEDKATHPHRSARNPTVPQVFCGYKRKLQKEFSEFQNERSGAWNPAQSSGFCLRESSIPTAGPSAHSWAKTKDTPFSPGSPGPLPLAENITISHGHTETNHLWDERQREEPKCQQGLPSSEPAKDFLSLLCPARERACHLWMSREAIQLSASGEPWEESKCQLVEGPHSQNRYVMAMGRISTGNPRGWNGMLKSSCQPSSERGKWAFPNCRAPRPCKTSGKVNLYPVF